MASPKGKVAFDWRDDIERVYGADASLGYQPGLSYVLAAASTGTGLKDKFIGLPDAPDPHGHYHAQGDNYRDADGEQRDGPFYRLNQQIHGATSGGGDNSYDDRIRLQHESWIGGNPEDNEPSWSLQYEATPLRGVNIWSVSVGQDSAIYHEGVPIAIAPFPCHGCSLMYDKEGRPWLISTYTGWGPSYDPNEDEIFPNTVPYRWPNYHMKDILKWNLGDTDGIDDKWSTDVPLTHRGLWVFAIPFKPGLLYDGGAYHNEVGWLDGDFEKNHQWRLLGLVDYPGTSYTGAKLKWLWGHQDVCPQWCFNWSGNKAFGVRYAEVDKGKHSSNDAWNIHLFELEILDLGTPQARVSLNDVTKLYNFTHHFPSQGGTVTGECVLAADWHRDDPVFITLKNEKLTYQGADMPGHNFSYNWIHSGGRHKICDGVVVDEHTEGGGWWSSEPASSTSRYRVLSAIDARYGFVGGPEIFSTYKSWFEVLDPTIEYFDPGNPSPFYDFKRVIERLHPMQRLSVWGFCNTTESGNPVQFVSDEGFTRNLDMITRTTLHYDSDEQDITNPPDPNWTPTQPVDWDTIQAPSAGWSPGHGSDYGRVHFLRPGGDGITPMMVYSYAAGVPGSLRETWYNPTLSGKFRRADGLFFDSPADMYGMGQSDYFFDFYTIVPW